MMKYYLEKPGEANFNTARVICKDGNIVRVLAYKGLMGKWLKVGNPKDQEYTHDWRDALKKEMPKSEVVSILMTAEIYGSNGAY